MDIFASLLLKTLNKYEKWLVISSIMASVAATYFLAIDGNRIEKINMKAIASLGESASSIKRKTVKDLGFKSIKKNTLLYSGDQVFNSDNDVVAIYFLNQQSLMLLPPNSLVEIEELKGRVQVEVKKGKAEIELARNDIINLKSGESVVELVAKGNSKVELEKEAETTTFKSESGTVGAIKEDGDIRELPTGKPLKVNVLDSSGKFQIIAPKDGESIASGLNEVTVGLSKKVFGMAILAKDKDFKVGRVEQKIKKEALVNLGRLEKGIYYLLIVTKKKKNRKITFKIVEPPEMFLSLPEDISYDGINKKLKIVLNWRKLTVGAIAEIEVQYGFENKELIKKTFRHGGEIGALELFGVYGDILKWKGRTLQNETFSNYSEEKTIDLKKFSAKP